jgi:hypothetical protein
MVGALTVICLKTANTFLVALDILVIVISLFLISGELSGKAAGGSLISGYFGKFRSFANYPFSAIVPLLLAIGLAIVGFNLIDNIFSAINNNNLSKITVSSVFFSGISISLVFIFLIGSHVLFPVALISASIPVISALAYPTINQKRLVSKYHDLEESLIKP